MQPLVTLLALALALGGLGLLLVGAVQKLGAPKGPARLEGRLGVRRLLPLRQRARGGRTRAIGARVLEGLVGGGDELLQQCEEALAPRLLAEADQFLRDNGPPIESAAQVWGAFSIGSPN